jgi:hypothetical protein
MEGVVVDPIDSPDFNPHTYREPNPETISSLEIMTARWRHTDAEAKRLRKVLNEAIIKAKDTGHSYGQIRDATGLSIYSIQIILRKAGRL